MATKTYIPIASITLGSDSSSVTFSGIDQSYRDLTVVVQGGLGASDGFFFARFNGDTSSSYSYVRMYGNGSSAVSDQGPSRDVIDIEAGSMTGDDNSFIMDIMDYSATDKHKTVLTRANQNLVTAYANRWANTAAITSITFDTTTQQIVAGSKFALYGIEA